MGIPPAWTAWQLAEFLEAVSAFKTEESVALGAVERAAEALDADVAAILSEGRIVASVGYPAGEVALADLRAVADDVAEDVPIPGSGRCPAVRVPMDHPEDANLVLARSTTTPMIRDELSLLRGIARVTSMTMRILRVLDDERAARMEVQLLLEQQAALRRVAVLVADGVWQADVFAAVAQEAGRLAHADVAQVIRYMPHKVAVPVAVWTSPGVDLHGNLHGDGVAAAVLHAGTPVRIDQPAPEHPACDVSIAAAKSPSAMICSAIGIPIVVAGNLWGAMIIMASRSAAMPADTEQRMSGFTELAATAISNAQARQELAASRTRAVTAADETRRRIGRRLHDGVQQRLASMALTVRTTQASIQPGAEDLASGLSQVATELQEVFQELQELASDLHPGILSRGGLGPAIRMICKRRAVPVDLDLDIDGRLPEPVEIAAYHIVDQSLANAVAHAHASTIRIDVALSRRNLTVSVCDDGVGGADPTRGTGLVGLRDRVAALGGTITLTSPPGGGTTITAEVPVDVQ